jgi:4-hydroxy-3-methylbut-2-en-1-yl diphosphate synthase IspG/GcpE
VIALLISIGAAFVLCILSTPALIRVLRAKGIGQQIRDDGPFAHPHEKKAGTPTMGGIAIVVSALFGYMVAHVSTEQTKFARTGITLMALVVGMAVVGFFDDYLGVRRGRNLGLRKRGLDLVACPSCGRAEVNVLELTQKVNAAIESEKFTVPMNVAVMGCVVNGPGEAREADVGIASGMGLGFILRQGEVVAKVPEDELVDALIAEARTVAAEKVAAGEGDD